jgi:hypothetical protein
MCDASADRCTSEIKPAMIADSVAALAEPSDHPDGVLPYLILAECFPLDRDPCQAVTVGD